MTRFAFLALLAACTTEPTATVTVHTAPQMPVVFHGADGRLLDSRIADADGYASGPMESGGMITYRVPSLTALYETLGDIEPGDLVTTRLPDDPIIVAGELPLTVTFPSQVAGNLVIVRVACGGGWVTRSGTPLSPNIVIGVPGGCLDDHGAALVHVFARDERAEATAFATRPVVTIPGALAIDRWDTDFVATPYRVTDLDPDLVSTQIDIRTAVDTVSFVQLAGEARLPTTTPPTGITVTALYSNSARLTIERRGQGLEVDGARLPRIKAIALGSTDDPRRPTVEVRSTEPIPSRALFEAHLAIAGTGWTLKLHGPVRIPELPPALQPLGPIELLEVDASLGDPDGQGMTTTALAM